MRTSDSAIRRWVRSDRAVNGGLTAIVALFLLALAWLIPLDTRNARGEQREMTTLNIWREMLGNLPPDAPFFLNSAVLAILSILALVTWAYIIIAVARLPR